MVCASSRRAPAQCEALRDRSRNENTFCPDQFCLQRAGSEYSFNDPDISRFPNCDQTQRNRDEKRAEIHAGAPIESRPPGWVHTLSTGSTTIVPQKVLVPSAIV
jgi:hypothetical protein